MKARYARRSLLYIPGSSQKMLGKAVDVKADAVILDLEDAVSIDEKDNARSYVADILPKLTTEEREVIVRINSADTSWCYKDITAVAGLGINTVIVPKADERSLITVDTMLEAVEKELGLENGTIGIIPLFETTYAIANAYKVLGASPRIDGVQLGAEDLTKEQEIVRTSEGTEIQYARQQLAMAARARGIDILDTPYTGIKDLDGLRRDAQYVKSIGFTGKTCIHPSHIEIINEVFSPTAEEIDFARGVVEAFEASVKEGKGACMYRNKMVDKPVAERAVKLLEKAERLGV